MPSFFLTTQVKIYFEGLGSIQKECFAWTYLTIRADFLQFCSTHAYIIDSDDDTDAVSIRLCGQIALLHGVHSIYCPSVNEIAC